MQVYKIVQTVNGRMVATLIPDIVAWADDNGYAISYVPDRWLAPRVQGFCGPMWDGLDRDGIPVIRYEDQSSYDTLSR